jgi:hypothetical protein
VRRPLGTSTDAKERMAALVGDVLGLPSVPVEDSGHDFFALPDGVDLRRSPAERALFGAWSIRDDVLSL